MPSSPAPLPRLAVRALSCGLTAAALLLTPALTVASDPAAAAAAGPAAPAMHGSSTREQPSTTAPDGDDSAGARYNTGRAGTAVGQIGNDNSSCTATVVGSDSGQVVVTAAHCVFVPEADVFGGGYSMTAEPGWVEDQQFYPGRDGDDAPFGIWDIESAWVDPRWQETGNPAFDVAFLTIAEQDGRTVADVVGSQGISFGATATNAVTALGYPSMAPFDGTTLRYCTEDDAAADPIYRGALAMDCAMNQGASGGPWLADFDESDGTGTVVAVSSFIALDGTDRMFASTLTDFAAELYRTADAN